MWLGSPPFAGPCVITAGWRARFVCPPSPRPWTRGSSRRRKWNWAERDFSMSQFAIGIDLGTTNSALSFYDLTAPAARAWQESILSIPQLSALGTVEERQLLPSFLYLPSGAEFADGALALPWNKKAGSIIGEFARSHGAKVPTRLVSSAKSWLSHSGADPTSALLPWQAPAEVERLSPVEVSARYLHHLAEAWDDKFARTKATAERGIANQEIILTVPASFDAAARDLTLQAATKAGLNH